MISLKKKGLPSVSTSSASLRVADWASSPKGATALTEFAGLIRDEPSQQQALMGGFAPEVDEDAGQRMRPSQLGFAVGPNDEQRGLLRPPREMPQREEHRFVGPLQVVKDDHEAC